MTCTHLRDLLDDYLADQLDEPDRRAVRAHLEDCADCRADEAAARFLAPRVAALPRAIPPGRGLWNGIDRRLTPRGARRAVRRWLPIAAAVAAAIGVGGWAVTILRRPADVPLPVAALPEPAPSAERAYRIAADELEAALLDGSRLMPAAHAAVAREVRTLNQALEESRQALAADPDNAVLRDLYRTVLRQKMDLLRRSAAQFAET